MFYLSIFLATLTFSEAFTLPFRQGPISPSEANEAVMRFMMVFMPIKSLMLGFKTTAMSLASSLMDKKISSMTTIFQTLMNKKSADQSLKNQKRNQDTCLQRFICEMSVENRNRRKKRFTNAMDQVMYQPEEDTAEPKIIVTVQFGSPEEKLQLFGAPQQPQNKCERYVSGCPYSAQDMIEALKKLRKVWRQVRLPKMLPSIAKGFFSKQQLSNYLYNM